MDAHNTFVESLNRLYNNNAINANQLYKLLTEGKITKEEYNKIVRGDVNGSTI